jgi:hypothetical protein
VFPQNRTRYLFRRPFLGLAPLTKFIRVNGELDDLSGLPADFAPLDWYTQIHRGGDFALHSSELKKTWPA